jgi:hypothetical protein
LETPTELEMYAANGSVIRRVAQIPGNVERLFDAETIVLQKMPALLDFRNDSTCPDGHDAGLKINFVAIISKKLNQKSP